MAEFGKATEPQTLLPDITQETLAEMIGASRSKVSGFMNRFRKLGFIEYNGRIRVNKSLLNVVLHDQPFEQDALSPDSPRTPPSASLSARRIAEPLRRINRPPDKPAKKPRS
jgi:hypothetical protein